MDAHDRTAGLSVLAICGGSAASREGNSLASMTVGRRTEGLRVSLEATVVVVLAATDKAGDDGIVLCVMGATAEPGTSCSVAGSLAGVSIGVADSFTGVSIVAASGIGEDGVKYGSTVGGVGVWRGAATA
ncbi:hypothetical protein PG991_010668 [Apiospora marii]|uniref:Uncharacterized protein n=1 Tax=Apiospora marii TaxID=335849 RepID=A0ABR1RD34_9PEZI